ncbi:MAG: hypothetical protein HKM28_04800, partial [Flavobacteriaceae bacterium]|nr:hypothetical protein [Flavobacteriaceae bacterium]
MMRPIPKRTYWIALCVSLFLTTCCLVIYIESQNKLNQEYNEQVESVGSMIVQDIELSVHDNILSLENLRERTVESDGEFMSYFKSDATRITAQKEAIKFVEWIDRNGIIREIHPLEENKAAYLLDIKPIEYRYDDWLQNSKNDRAN